MQGGVSTYLANLKDAQEMLAAYMGQKIIVGGNFVISDGAPQTFFSATERQKANPYSNSILGMQLPGPIIPGMELRDRNRMDTFATPSGVTQPVYPIEEWFLGGKLVATLLGTAGRLLAATDIVLLERVSASPAGNISAQQITREGIALRLAAEDRTLLGQLDSVTSTGVRGDLREYVVNNYFVRNGYRPLEGKCGANNCFDGVYVKGDTIYLVEVKQLKSDGSIKLNGPSEGFPTQMSQDWVENAVSRLYKGTAEQRAIAEVIMSALGNGKVVKIVTGVDRNGVTAVKIK